MAASATAKPTKIGARRDDAPASDVVRRISSYGNTCGDSERYPKNSQKPCNLLIRARHRAKSLQRCPSAPASCPRAARALPARARPRSADASGLQAVAVAGEHPYSLA